MAVPPALLAGAVAAGVTTNSNAGVNSNTRKTMGFSTVSHFNLVHVDCHLAAVRQVGVINYRRYR